MVRTESIDRREVDMLGEMGSMVDAGEGGPPVPEEGER